jgi:hypothetical protein
MAYGKLYAIWSPSLIHAAMRHKNLTFDELSLQFAQRVFGLSNDAMVRLRGTGTMEESIATKTMVAMKNSMMGQHLYRMNVRALTHVASRLNEIDEKGLDVPDLYSWLRSLMTMATAEVSAWR